MENQKPTVLIIDDETDTLTMFRLFLSSYGYEVLVAEDGHSGLAQVVKENPAIVFTDLKMPGMDGFEVLKQIKKIAPRTEVIVITGHSDMDLVIQALNLDTTDFIIKPISPEAVEAALHRAMERLQRPTARSGKVTFDLNQGVGRICVEGCAAKTVQNCSAASNRRCKKPRPAFCSTSWKMPPSMERGLRT